VRGTCNADCEMPSKLSPANGRIGKRQ
jgi:hypothetical protein